MNVDNALESGLIPDARRMYYCHPAPTLRISVNLRTVVYVKMLNTNALGIAAPEYSGLFYGSSNAEEM